MPCGDILKELWTPPGPVVPDTTMSCFHREKVAVVFLHNSTGWLSWMFSEVLIMELVNRVYLDCSFCVQSLYAFFIQKNDTKSQMFSDIWLYLAIFGISGEMYDHHMITSLILVNLQGNIEDLKISYDLKPS